MPRTFLFSLALFLGSAYWKLIPPLVFLLTGWRLRFEGIMGDPFFSSLWVQAGFLAFLMSAWALLWGGRYLGKASPDQHRLSAGLCLVFLYLSYCLEHFMTEISPSQAQAISFQGAGWIYGVVGLFLIGAMIWPPRKGVWVLGAVLLFSCVLTPILVRSFPFERNFSDILISVRQSCLELLRGIPPYSMEPGRSWEGGSNYLPGSWLAYLPAVALDWDLRYCGAFYWVGFAVLVWKGMTANNRSLGTWALALFLLNPWLLMRQDTYFPSYLFCWAGFFLALQEKKNERASVLWGIALSMHLFSWALWPLWLAWTWKNGGYRTARRSFVLTAMTATVVLLPFLVWSPQGFVEGTLFHFAGANSIAISHFGLGVWLGRWPGLLTVFSIISLGAGVWGILHEKATPHSLFRWLSASLGLALLASYHIQHYYFFVPLAFLLFHEVTLPKERAQTA